MRKTSKSIIAYILIAALSFFTVSDSSHKAKAKEEPNTIISVDNNVDLGDADEDGIVSIIDVTLIQRYIAGYTVSVINKRAADFDEDNTISIIDATLIQMFLVNLFPFETEEYDQVNPTAKRYIDETEYPSDDYSFSLLSHYISGIPSKKLEAVGLKLTIPKDGKLRVYSDTVRYEINVKSGETELFNITPGKTARISLVDQNNNLLWIKNIKANGRLRMIKATSTYNVRDFGGWNCDGGTVRYNKLFRGGEIGESDVFLFHDILGIRAELNLRWDNEITRDYSLIGDDVEFTHISGPWYSLKESKSYLPDAHALILNYCMDTVIEGKPLYIHCAAGADRTGTIAFLLESLLGISQSDMDKDYELTSFRTGIDNDNHARRRDENDWKNFMAQFNQFEGRTMRDKVVNWALSIGISLDKINAFRSAMIDGDPEILTLDKIKGN